MSSYDTQYNLKYQSEMLEQKKGSHSQKNDDSPGHQNLPASECQSLHRKLSGGNYGMAKSTVFSREDMPPQLDFKFTQDSHSSAILRPQQVEGGLELNVSNGGTKQFSSPLSSSSSQKEVPLRFKAKTQRSNIDQGTSRLKLQDLKKESGNGSFQTRPSHSQSGVLHNGSLHISSGKKLQFKDPLSRREVNPTKSQIWGEQAPNASTNLRYKPNIKAALKESAEFKSSALERHGQSVGNTQSLSTVGRLEKYRKKTYKDMSEHLEEKIGPQSQVIQNNLQKHVPTKQKALHTGGPKTPVGVANSFYYSYPHPGFVNPYQKDTREELLACGTHQGYPNYYQQQHYLGDNYGPSPLPSPNVQRGNFINNGIQQRVSLETPNSHNSNFSKFKNNSVGSSDKNVKSLKEKLHRNSNVKLADFNLGKKLGKGKFGDVFLAQHKATHFICALKIIKKQTLIDQKVDHQFIRELKIQFYMSHTNIISLYGFFDDQTNFYMMLEFAVEGHLFGMIREKTRLTEDETKVIVRHICQGISYMHYQRILHRDLKPENILIQFGIPKICDFGWAIYRADTLRDTFCGTPLYISPEILTGEKYDEGVDLWAVGILTYQLLIGRIPFKIKTQSDLLKIVNQQIVFPPEIPLSPESRDFVMSMLQRNTDERYDIEQMLHHTFLTGIPQTMNQLP